MKQIFFAVVKLAAIYWLLAYLWGQTGRIQSLRKKLAIAWQVEECCKLPAVRIEDYAGHYTAHPLPRWRPDAR